MNSGTKLFKAYVRCYLYFTEIFILRYSRSCYFRPFFWTFWDLKKKLKIEQLWHKMACINYQLQFLKQLKNLIESKHQWRPADGSIMKKNLNTLEPEKVLVPSSRSLFCFIMIFLKCDWVRRHNWKSFLIVLCQNIFKIFKKSFLNTFVIFLAVYQTGISSSYKFSAYFFKKVFLM